MIWLNIIQSFVIISFISADRNHLTNLTVLFLRRPHQMNKDECDFVIQKAIEKLHNEGKLSQSIQFNVINRPSCDNSTEDSAYQPVYAAAKAYYQTGIDAIIGPYCSPGMKFLVPLTVDWNIPVIGYLSVSSELSDKSNRPTLARVSIGLETLAAATVTLIKKFKWKKIGILVDKENILSGSIFDGIIKELQDTDIERKEVPVVMKNWDQKREKALQVLKVEARIILVIMTYYDWQKTTAKIMEDFSKANMTNDKYLYILPCPQADFETVEFLTEEAKEGFRHSLVITPKGLHVETRNKFQQDMEQWKMDMNDTSAEAVTAQMLLHDAIYLYGMVIGQLYDDKNYNGSLNDGREIVEKMKNIKFDGKSGGIHMSATADRIPHYSVFMLIADKIEQLYLIDVVRQCQNCSGTNIKYGWEIKALSNESLPTISDEPTQTTEKPDKPDIAHIIGIAFLCFLALLIIAFFGYRKVQTMRLEKMSWRIQRSSLVVSVVTKGSKLSLIDESQANQEQVTTGVGSVLETKVVFTRYPQKRTLLMNKTHLITLNQEIIFNKELQLDQTFQFSFMRDILLGLEFIHRSPVHVHGALDISNCHVDNHWSVKLSHFGLQHFLYDLSSLNEITYKQPPAIKLLRTAPELLRSRPLNVPMPATKEGDIYSFGIIMYQILFRFEPFQYGMVATEELLEHLVKDGAEVTPKMPHNTNMDLNLLMALKACWSEDNRVRPQIKELKLIIDSLSPAKGSLMDHMVEMMEKYAGNLEKLVRQRTALLEEAQEKADKLLYEMLPKSVAMELKAGHVVKPRLFRSATVFFSDIVQFTNLCSESTPLQIVNFLNSLFSKFDAVIEKHDAYKVETIGDAYLVVSGLPKQNRDLHAWHIADMALQLCEVVAKFEVPHRQDKVLQIRCGSHSGPVAAGVIGMTAPRYCLFGDTVNTAARMESSGEPMKVQITETTRQLLKEYPEEFFTVERGVITVKGKGQMKTYWLSRPTGGVKA